MFETFTPGRPVPPGLDVLTPQLKDSFMRAYERAQQNRQSVYATLFAKDMRLERAFVARWRTLIAGTDPTGAGGVVPGYSDQRQVELLVEAGFTPVEAIKIATLNGATFMGRDARIGSIARGKQADLVVVAGDPSANDRGHPQGRDGVQEGRRVRSGQADRVGARTGRYLVTARQDGGNEGRTAGRQEGRQKVGRQERRSGGTTTSGDG